MKRLNILGGIGMLLAAIGSQTAPSFIARAETTTTQTNEETRNVLNLRQACTKPLGFFPTPSKILCVRAATGLPSNASPTIIATIFTVCQGHSSPLTKGTNPLPAFPTLGACLSSPDAVAQINRELAAGPKVQTGNGIGIPSIGIVNSDILR